jgi:hypothetical protein
MRTFASLMALSQSALFFDLSFQLLILPLILLHCLGRFHSIWLFRGHILGFLTISFLQWQFVSLSPNPQPGGPVRRIYNPRGRVAQLYPQALGNNFGRLLRPAWAAVGLLFSPVTTRGTLSHKWHDFRKKCCWA